MKLVQVARIKKSSLGISHKSSAVLYSVGCKNLIDMEKITFLFGGIHPTISSMIGLQQPGLDRLIGLIKLIGLIMDSLIDAKNVLQF